MRRKSWTQFRLLPWHILEFFMLVTHPSGQIISRIPLEGSPVAARMAAEYAVTCAV